MVHILNPAVKTVHLPKVKPHPENLHQEVAKVQRKGVNLFGEFDLGHVSEHQAQIKNVEDDNREHNCLIDKERKFLHDVNLSIEW